MPSIGEKMENSLKFIDIFCGIGGFRIAAENAMYKAGITPNGIFSSDIDIECQNAYEANFNHRPRGDISEINSNDIPNHDLLLAGFPCQPFSIIGKRKGFNDTRGTLFFDIARILEAKRPTAFVLENVKQLVGHDQGQTMLRIMDVLKHLGYKAEYKVFNALDFGLPQKRERVFIVGINRDVDFQWPTTNTPMKPLKDILEKDPPKKYFASDYIRNKRYSIKKPTKELTIWHENKSGNISAYPYSCALRAGASYNYLLVNGERRLTPREMLRLQGFPENFQIICSDSQTRKQAGNALPVPVAEAVIKKVIEACNWGKRPIQSGDICEEKNAQASYC